MVLSDWPIMMWGDFSEKVFMDRTKEVKHRREFGHQRGELSQQEARGTVAGLYSEIRDTMGLSMVNLIYRRMAAEEGVLEWVWAWINGAINSLDIEDELAQLSDGVAWPAVKSVQRASLPLLGIDEVEEIKLASVLSQYNRGNSLNLLLLNAFLAHLKKGKVLQGPRMQPLKARRVHVKELPPILDLGQMGQDTAAVVRVLAKYVSPPGSLMIPSLFRHLAHWPGFLALVAPHILQSIANGEVRKVSSCLKERAVSKVSALRLQTTDIITEKVPSIDIRDYWAEEIDSYLQKPIPEMIVIGNMIESILPDEEK